MTEEELKQVKAERDKLLRALCHLIPWAGESPTVPPWANDTAKKRNREMCEAAITEAADCLPVGFNGDVEGLIASKA